MSKKIIYKGKTYILESQLANGLAKGLDQGLQYTDEDHMIEGVLEDYGYTVNMEDSRIDPTLLADFGIPESGNMLVIEGTKDIAGVSVIVGSTISDDGAGNVKTNTHITIGNMRTEIPPQSDSNALNRLLRDKLSKLDKVNLVDYMVSLIK